MYVDGVLASIQNERSVGGYVALETLRRHVGLLDRFVSAHGENRLAVHGERGAAYPVVVSRHVDDLLARDGIDHSNGSISRSECQVFAVRRPRGSVKSIKSDRLGKLEFHFLQIPNLDFAHLARLSSRNRQSLAVGRKGHGFHSLGKAYQTGHQARTIRLMQQSLMKPRHGKQLAIRRKVQ